MKRKNLERWTRIPFKRMEMSVFSFALLCMTFCVFVFYCVFSIQNIGKEDFQKNIITVLESGLLLLLIFVPQILTCIFKVRIPMRIEIMYVGFTCSAMLFGEIFKFYEKIFFWDSVLHTLSGFFVGMLAYYLANTLLADKDGNTKCSPWLLMIFAVSLTLAVSVLWKFVEFATDGILKTNMQSYLSDDATFSGATPLVDHDAIRDTMKDLFLAFIGSIVLAVIGTVQLKTGKKGFATAKFEKTTKSFHRSKKREKSRNPDSFYSG